MTKKAGKQALHRKSKLVERQIGAAADSEAPEAHLRPEHETPVQTGDVGGIADVVEGERRNGTEHDTEGGPDLPPGGERQSGSGSRNTAHCGEQNYCITRAPLIKGGAVSAAKTGTVADLGPVRMRASPSALEHASPSTGNVPIPSPRTKRAANKFHRLFVQPAQMQANAETVAVTKMVPRRPRRLLRGAVSQHPG